MSPLWISIQTSLWATAISFVTGMVAAYAMSRYRGRGRGLLDGLLILPLVLPPTVVGFFLLLLFGRRSIVGQALEQIGITVVFSWPATVIAAAVVAFPLMYRTTLGAFEQVSPNMLDAARTLGASEWRTFRRILLPLAWPGITAGTVLAFARALGEFGATLMLAGNIPGRTQTMPVAIFFAAEGGDLQGALMWVAWICVLSLGAIAGMNYWSRPRRRTMRAASREPARVSHIGAVTTVSHAPMEVDVRKRYPEFELAVKFSNTGGTLGVLGASGSGKSLTLRAIAGLEKPDSGRVVINYKVLFDSAKGISVPPAERRIGIVFQDYALFPHMTVRENIAFGLRRGSVDEWARLVHVETMLARYPDELSGGQQQRVALARALAMEPAALLLDEPFAALDYHLRRQMEEQVRALLAAYAGAAVFVTHDRSEAYRLCDEMVVLSRGRVEAAGPKRALFDNPGSLETARVTGCKNLAGMRLVDDRHIRVDAWDCTLEVATAPGDAKFVGIRAHDIEFVEDSLSNTLFCTLAHTVESPFEMAVYLRLGAGGILKAELPIAQWRSIEQRPQPWKIRLPPERLRLLRE